MKLKPLTSPTRYRPLCAFDVQGDNDAAMVAAALITEEGERVFEKPSHLVEALTTRKMRGHYVYSHRLTYDAGVLIPDLPGDTELLFIKEKLFKGRIAQSGRHKVYFADSSGMWGGLPLSEIGREVGLDERPPPPEIVRGLPGSQDYEAVPFFNTSSLRDYCVRQSRIVLQGVELLQNELHHLGGELGNTLASTALNLFKRRYLDNEYWTPHDYRNQFARKAYYGGRCEPIALGWHDHVSVYDFRSHYPYQMAVHPFPNPNATIGPREPGRLSWIMELEGCSDCTVYVPPMKYPVLPFRLGWQVFFPTGEFRGTWCHNELRYALEQGVQIKSIHATMYSKDTVRPFTDYVHDLWHRREKLLAQGSPRARVYKLLLNSLSGKFGQREEGGLFELVTMDAYERMGHRSGVEFLELRDTVYAKVPIPTKRIPAHIIVIWSAYITAYGRIALHKAILDTPGPIIYWDTDSLMCFSDLPTGNGLGDLSLQVEGATVDVIAPKMYDLILPSGERKPVAKGVPAEVQGHYCTYKEVEYWKALNWQEAVKQKLNPSSWAIVRRRAMFDRPKRRYIKTPGWRDHLWVSEPWEVEELLRQYPPR